MSKPVTWHVLKRQHVHNSTGWRWRKPLKVFCLVLSSASRDERVKIRQYKTFYEQLGNIIMTGRMSADAQEFDKTPANFTIVKVKQQQPVVKSEVACNCEVEYGSLHQWFLNECNTCKRQYTAINHAALFYIISTIDICLHDSMHIVKVCFFVSVMFKLAPPLNTEVTALQK